MTQEIERKSEGLLDGKIAIVTGGTSGIGLAIAKEFLLEGAKVAVFDLNPIPRELHRTGMEDCLSFPLDIRDEHAVKQAIESIETLLGPISVLVNNAGIDPKNEFLEDLGLESWSKVLDVNLNGSLLLTQLVGKRMIEQKIPGAIIFMATIHTKFAFVGEAAYDASKFGMIGLMRVTASEWAKYGIRANAISPGAIAPTGINKDLSSEELTRLGKIIPIGRVGKPEEIATVAAFLASDKTSYVTGAEWRVDGGLSIKNPLEVGQ